MVAGASTPDETSGGQRPVWHIVLAFALLAPASVFFVSSYVEPALWTVSSGFQSLSW